MSFSKYDISNELLNSLKKEGIERPTKVQDEIIPLIINGRDVLCSSETGSGKTISFAIPIIDSLKKFLVEKESQDKKRDKRRVKKQIKAIVVAPTRELAKQIAKEFRRFSDLGVATVYGGVSIGPQVARVRKADIIVGTPGRILDLMRQNELHLDNVEFLVLDECDRMFDMGFIEDIETIIKATPKSRQTLLFSATVSSQVKETSRKHMTNPEYVTVKPHLVKGSLKQKYYVVRHNQKLSLLIHLLKKNKEKTLVFCRTKRAVELVGKTLRNHKFNADYLHGGLSQARREKVVDKLRDNRLRIVVATDVAARGLDIKNIEKVINYDLPDNVDTYVHRVGRTARQGKPGTAISLVSAQDFDSFGRILEFYNKDIKRVSEKRVPMIRLNGPGKPSRFFDTGDLGKKRESRRKVRVGERAYDPGLLAELD